MFNLEKCAFLRLCVILVTLALSTSGCMPSPGGGGLRVLVDGEMWKDGAVSQESGDGLRVYITCDGQPVDGQVIPFAEGKHRVEVVMG